MLLTIWHQLWLIEVTSGICKMAEFLEKNPFKMIGTVLGGGFADRDANLNPGYIQPFIPTPGYDKKNPYGIDPETERVVISNGKPVVIAKDAPRGWGRGSLASLYDSTIGRIHGSDWDKRGPGLNAWQDFPEEGYGRLAEKVEPFTANPKYPGNPNLPGAGPVPKLNQGLNWGQMAINEWNRYRSRGDVDWGLQRTADALKDATYYGYEVDRAQMYDFMNSPMGQAKTSLLAQQAVNAPRYAKAALIDAIANRKKASSTPQEAAAQMYAALRTRDIA